MNTLRRAVSLKKKRFTEQGFDLDLAYITDRIIAMGYPAQKMEALYRNPMSEVQRFLETFHKDHYKVYNLCSERTYPVECFLGRVAWFPFDDHNCPPLSHLIEFCADAERWLRADPHNAIAVHCKAGKGRTGLMICCLLMHMGICRTAPEALAYYAGKRTHDNKGVTIPSQVRYVYYYERMLQGASTVPLPIRLHRIRLQPAPKLKSDLTLAVYCDDQLVFRSQPGIVSKDATGGRVDIVAHGLHLAGNLKMVVYAEGGMFGKEKSILQFWVHTAFMPGRNLLLRRAELDHVVKDKKFATFPAEFTCELLFEPAIDGPAAGSAAPSVAAAAGSATEGGSGVLPSTPAALSSAPNRSALSLSVASVGPDGVGAGDRAGKASLSAASGGSASAASAAAGAASTGPVLHAASRSGPATPSGTDGASLADTATATSTGGRWAYGGAVASALPRSLSAASAAYAPAPALGAEAQGSPAWPGPRPATVSVHSATSAGSAASGGPSRSAPPPPLPLSSQQQQQQQQQSSAAWQTASEASPAASGTGPALTLSDLSAGASRLVPASRSRFHTMTDFDTLLAAAMGRPASLYEQTPQRTASVPSAASDRFSVRLQATTLPPVTDVSDIGSGAAGQTDVPAAAPPQSAAGSTVPAGTASGPDESMRSSAAGSGTALATSPPSSIRIHSWLASQYLSLYDPLPASARAARAQPMDLPVSSLDSLSAAGAAEASGSASAAAAAPPPVRRAPPPPPPPPPPLSGITGSAVATLSTGEAESIRRSVSIAALPSSLPPWASTPLPTGPGAAAVRGVPPAGVQPLPSLATRGTADTSLLSADRARGSAAGGSAAGAAAGAFLSGAPGSPDSVLSGLSGLSAARPLAESSFTLPASMRPPPALAASGAPAGPGSSTGGASAVVRHAADYVLRPAPSAPTVSPAGRGAVAISWQPPSGGGPVQRYQLFCARTPFPVVTPHDPVLYEGPGLSHYENTLAAGVQYALAVAAQTASGWTVLSPVTLFRMPSHAPPGRPSAPRFVEVRPTRIALEWDPPADAGGAPITGYKVYCADGSAGIIPSTDAPPVYQGGSTRFEHTGLTPHRWYSYAVVACNAAGDSRLGLFDCVQTPAAPADGAV